MPVEQYQCLGAHFKAASGDLLPFTAMYLAASVSCLAGKMDDVGENELRDTSSVGIGRIKDRDAAMGGGDKVCLVGAWSECEMISVGEAAADI